MAEMAVVSARQARLRKAAEEGNAGAETALALAEQPTRFLSTVQVGITSIGILSGALGGATVAEELALRLARIPGLAPYSEAIGVTVVVAVVTYLSLVFGELVPKRLALNNAERIAAVLGPWMAVAARMTTPLVSFLSFSTDMVLRALRISPISDPSITEEEIKILIDQGRMSGVFEDVEQEIVERVFRLSDRTVHSVMTPRTDMVWLDVEASVEENLSRITGSGYTNFVVCAGDLDHVQGIISLRQILVELAAGGPVTFKADPHYLLFPKGTRALTVLESLRQSHSPIALVMDEFGSVAGLVTLSDMLEALVGDIPGLVAGGEPEATQRADGSWLLDGMMSVDELQMLLDLDSLPRADAGYTTVSGMVMAELGRIPNVGDTFDWQAMRFEVVDMDGFRVDKVLVMQV